MSKQLIPNEVQESFQSKINSLPNHILIKRHKWIYYTQSDILTMLNEEVDSLGAINDDKISLVELNRYVSKVLTKQSIRHKGKISKVDLLPVDIKCKLWHWISIDSFTQREILDQLNREIEISGLDDNRKIAYSALNRWISKTPYNKRFDLK